jgi:hypothetical protein
VDELTTLKEFRADVTGAVAGDPAREHAIAAIRALIEREAAATPVRSYHSRMQQLRRPKSVVLRRRLFVVALVSAAIAAILAVLPMRQSSPSLVGQALAAIGSGNVLHVIGEMPTGRQLLDLRSGQTKPVMQREEIWFDESRGLRRDVTWIGGTIVGDTFQSKEGGFTPHGIIYDCTWIAAHPTAATKARVSCNLSGNNGTTPHSVPRPKPTLDPGLASFADSYRSALASGAAHEGGSGVVDGNAVDWLVFDTKQGSERVALDAATHKPILIDGPNALRLRVTTIETIDSAGGRFQKPTPDETPLRPSFGKATDQQKLPLSGAAIAAAYRSAVWAGSSVDGLALASATVQQLVSSYYHHARPPESGVGLQLQYGSLTPNGHADFTKPYLTVSEAPKPVLATAYMWPEDAGIDPAPGQFYFSPIAAGQPGSIGLAVGFTIINGHAISVQASSNELLLAAARALTAAK